MSVLPLVTALLIYRILVIVLGSLVALYGMLKFRSSRAKTGEMEFEFKGAKGNLKNVSAGALYIVLGSLGVVVGLWKSPVVTTEERDAGGNVHIIKVEALPPLKHIAPEDVSIADLLTNSEKYSDKMVRVRGKNQGQFHKKGADKEYMVVTLKESDATIKVFSLKVEWFEKRDELIVTGKFVMEEDKKGIDASPNVGGKIERAKADDKDSTGYTYPHK